MSLPIPVPQKVTDPYALAQVLRDIILQAQAQLPLNTSKTNKFLVEIGDGTNAGLPSWSTIGPTDQPIPFRFIQTKTVQTSMDSIRTLALACNGLNPASTQRIDVCAAPPPSSGQVLTATGPAAATWQTPATPTSPGTAYYNQQTFGGY